MQLQLLIRFLVQRVSAAAGSAGSSIAAATVQRMYFMARFLRFLPHR